MAAAAKRRLTNADVIAMLREPPPPTPAHVRRRVEWIPRLTAVGNWLGSRKRRLTTADVIRKLRAFCKAPPRTRMWAIGRWLGGNRRG